MQCAQEDIKVRSTSREHIPQHCAHVPLRALQILFFKGHFQEASPREAVFLNLAGEKEAQFPYSVIRVDRFTGRHIILPEIISGYSLENRSRGSSLCSTVRCTYAIFVKPGDASITDKYYAVEIRLVGTLNIYSGKAPA